MTTSVCYKVQLFVCLTMRSYHWVFTLFKKKNSEIHSWLEWVIRYIIVEKSCLESPGYLLALEALPDYPACHRTTAGGYSVQIKYITVCAWGLSAALQGLLGNFTVIGWRYATSAVEPFGLKNKPWCYLMELKPVAMTVSKGSSQVGGQLRDLDCLVEGFHGRHNVHLAVRDKTDWGSTLFLTEGHTQVRSFYIHFHCPPVALGASQAEATCLCPPASQHCG